MSSPWKPPLMDFAELHLKSMVFKILQRPLQSLSFYILNEQLHKFHCVISMQKHKQVLRFGACLVCTHVKLMLV